MRTEIESDDRPTGGDTFTFSVGSAGNPVLASIALGQAHTAAGLPPTSDRAKTGRDCRFCEVGAAHTRYDCLSFCELLCGERMTGQETRAGAGITALVLREMASDQPFTCSIYDVRLAIDQVSRAVIAQVLPPAGIDKGDPPAKRLQEISGLDQGRLGKICGVSRQTYHNWISRQKVNARGFAQLLEVLPLVEEAMNRLGGPVATSKWLLTPVSPGGKKPLDLLMERQYEAFRGFLLGVPTGREVVRPLRGSSRRRSGFSNDEFEAAKERVRPRAWQEEDE